MKKHRNKIIVVIAAPILFTIGILGWLMISAVPEKHRYNKNTKPLQPSNQNVRKHP